MSLPEFDGIIHSCPVTTMERDAEGKQVTQEIAERMNMLVRKAKKLALLRIKPNAEKKIAIVFHNHPSTNSNIGSCSAIDSIESVRLLLQDLRDASYVVDHIPADRQEFIDELIAGATNDRDYMSEKQIDNADAKLLVSAYRDYYKTLPEKVQQRLEHD